MSLWTDFKISIQEVFNATLDCDYSFIFYLSDRDIKNVLSDLKDYRCILKEQPGDLNGFVAN